MTEKLEKIRNIKRIIDTYGGFHISEVEGEDSPVAHTIGKDFSQLVEGFYEQATIVTYINGMEIDEDYLDYENLSSDLIDAVNIVVENYEAEQVVTHKRIS